MWGPPRLCVHDTTAGARNQPAGRSPVHICPRRDPQPSVRCGAASQCVASVLIPTVRRRVVGWQPKSDALRDSPAFDGGRWLVPSRPALCPTVNGRRQLVTASNGSSGARGGTLRIEPETQDHGVWRVSSDRCRAVKGRAYASGACGPGRHSRVATAARIVPGTGERVAILAERAFVVRRGVPLAHPDSECVVLDLVGVVQRLAFRETVVARPDVRAGLLTVPLLVTDDLQALVAAEVDMLQQEEAAFGPLVDNCSRMTVAFRTPFLPQRRLFAGAPSIF
jgi:hypothetical protein